MKIDTSPLILSPFEAERKAGARARTPLFAGVALAVATVLWLAWQLSPPREPAWQGRRLSEWLDAYDSHNRFVEGGFRGLRSPLSDADIQQALEGMREDALPTLLRWLAAKPGRTKPRLNQVLRCQSVVGWRFKVHDRGSEAVTGFMAYHTNALRVLPDLIELTKSSDPNTRLVAYEAAFFTRPEKKVFLSMANRALLDEDRGVQEVGESWMRTRFPEGAEKADRHVETGVVPHSTLGGFLPPADCHRSPKS